MSSGILIDAESREGVGRGQLGALYIMCIKVCQKCVISRVVRLLTQLSESGFAGFEDTQDLDGLTDNQRGSEPSESPGRPEFGLYIYYVRHFGTFWDIS